MAFVGMIIWTCASKSSLDFVNRIQSRALKLLGDDRVASSITSLGHRRNVSCIVLFRKILFRTLGINTTTPGIHEEYHALQMNAYTVATMSHRTTHYRKNSFFTRTARLWNNLPTVIFPTSFIKARMNQHLLLSPHSI